MAKLMTSNVMTTSFDIWLQNFARNFDEQFAITLDSDGIKSSRLHQAMRYALLGEGKRIRPALCSLVAGADVDSKIVMQAAMAIEAVHTYSLVHDDLPAMDDDCLRRGRATAHVEFDEATAILCGDALLTYAFELLSTVDIVAEQRLALISLLSSAIGHSGMVLGQQLDIDATSKELDWNEVQQIHQLKTTALISASIQMGAILSGQQHGQWAAFAEKIGMLFQVVDDILDSTADSEQLGKTAGKDSAASKQTAVSALGLNAARQFAADLCAESKLILHDLEVEDSAHLIQLPDFLLGRSF